MHYKFWKYKRNTSKLFSLCCSLLVVFSLLSCNKKFDEPPAYMPPDIKPTLTIAQLKAQHIIGTYETLSSDDIIAGIVIANDSSGNFYKQIILEDTSGGIAVNIDDYNLYTSYPLGRQVFIKLKGLILYDDNKLIALGGSKDALGNINSIAASLKSAYIIKGTYNNVVIPKVVDVTDLNDAYQNTLIQLNNFEFSDADTTKLYADTSSAKNSVNYIIKNCSSKSITLRTTGFASFAGAALPNGNGSITAIFSVFGSTKQIYIRDPSDVQFTNERCNGGGTGQVTSIANIRSMYTGSNIKLGNYKVGGVVISDAASKNISTGSVVLQDGNAGISVYFGGTIAYNIGDSIVLDVFGDSLLNYQGSLEIKTSFASDKPVPVATGRAVIPQQLTIAQLSANLSSIEFTLVKIVQATASGSAFYSGNNALTDATGVMSLFTSSSATFANDLLPADTSDWIGYAKFFGTTKEFQIRNTNDVTKSNENTGSDGIELTASPFNIDFNNIASGLPSGVLVKLSATQTFLGTNASFTATPVSWSNTSTGFKNFASATGLTSISDATAQNASFNRALGLKQTGTTGYDPGAAFVFQINNTTGKHNLTFNFLLQSLDDAIGRTTTWQVDYAVGDNPSSFTNIPTSPASLTTGPLFSSMPVSVNYGNALDDQGSKVWIRIVTFDATTGSGSRASSAIDDVQITWN